MENARFTHSKTTATRLLSIERELNTVLIYDVPTKQYSSVLPSNYNTIIDLLTLSLGGHMGIDTGKYGRKLLFQSLNSIPALTSLLDKSRGKSYVDNDVQL